MVGTMYRTNNNFNLSLQDILNAKRQGKNPQSFMNDILQKNPQIQQTMTQFKNMTNGKNPRDFVLQLAKQQGYDEASIGIINEILNK